jgi:hypothetical protein
LKSGKLDWRILRPLSNFAVTVLTVIWIFDFFQDFALDESVMDDPVARKAWLGRQHWYTRIELVILALAIALRIAFWLIEYVNERRQISQS